MWITRRLRLGCRISHLAQPCRTTGEGAGAVAVTASSSTHNSTHSNTRSSSSSTTHSSTTTRPHTGPWRDPLHRQFSSRFSLASLASLANLSPVSCFPISPSKTRKCEQSVHWDGYVVVKRRTYKHVQRKALVPEEERRERELMCTLCVRVLWLCAATRSSSPSCPPSPSSPP